MNSKNTTGQHSATKLYEIAVNCREKKITDFINNFHTHAFKAANEFGFGFIKVYSEDDFDKSGYVDFYDEYILLHPVRMNHEIVKQKLEQQGFHVEFNTDELRIISIHWNQT